MYSLFREGEGYWGLVGTFASLNAAIAAASNLESFLVEMKVCGGSSIVFVKESGS